MNVADRHLPRKSRLHGAGNYAGPHVRTQRRLVEDRLTFDVSIGVSQCLVDFLRQLLHFNAEARLGLSQIDAEDVKMHPFYCDISWDDVVFKYYMPSFCPIEKLSDEEDVRFFDSMFTEQCVVKDEFADFAYTG